MGTETSKGHGTGDEFDDQATVGSVAFDPVGGGGLAAGATDRPVVFEGVGEPPEVAQDRALELMVAPNQLVPPAFLAGGDPVHRQFIQDGSLVSVRHSFWLWHPPSQ